MALAAGNPQTATIMVTDLVGSTELRASVGEERAEALRRLHDRLIAAEITSRNGSVVKGLGDGALAMFAGAADAVAAAVAIQQAMAMHNRRSREAPLRVRIGISAGDVTIEDGDCFGTPVVEASRLCGHAAGEQILVAELVRLLARGRGDHEFNAVGELDLKGLPEPVAAAEVRWDAARVSSVPLPGPLAVTDWYPFAGRSSEVQVVTSRWKEAAHEGVRFVALSGEPGMGKTRTATELARSVHDDGAIVLYGRCDEELDTPYRPFVEALRHLVAHVPDAILVAHVAAVGASLSTLVPELCERTDCDTELSPTVEADRTRLFAAVEDLLRRTALEAPVLLVLDDLHWADRSSLLLLRHLISEGSATPMLVLGTYRDTDLARTHPLAAALADLRRNPVVERVALEGLGVEEVASFLTAAAGTGEVDVPGLARLAELLFAETEGNPFFLSEVLSHLMESRAIYLEGGRWVGDRDLIARLGVPEGVREVLGRRLSALSDDANEALTVAAVIGQEFSVPVLAAVLGVDADDCVDRLDEAVARRLLGEAPSSFDTFRFSHALVRQTLSEELTTSRRVRLHRKVAAALEEHGGTTEQLAHHYGEAAVMGEEDKALTYARAAGDEAMERFAFEQAASWYRRALEMDEALDPDAGRRGELLLALGEAMNASGDVLDARSVFVDAFDLAAGIGRTDLAVRAVCEYGGENAVWIDATDSTALGLIDRTLEMVEAGAPERVLLLVRRSHWLTLVPNSTEERRSMTVEAVGIARALGDLRLIAKALISCAEVLRGRAGTSEAFAGLAEEVISLARETEDPRRYCEGLYCRLQVEVVTNRLDDASATVAELRQVAEEMRHVVWLWEAAASTVSLALLRGDYDAALAGLPAERLYGRVVGETATVIQYAHEIALAQRAGDTAAELELFEKERSFPLMGTSWLEIPIALLRGEVATAREQIPDFVAAMDAAMPDEFRLNATGHLAVYALDAGADDVCALLYERLLPAAGSWVCVSPEIVNFFADVLLSRLATRLGRREDAERHGRDAVTALEESLARPHLATACVELAAAVEDRTEAAHLLARADAIADELGYMPARQRVDEVAAELSLSRPLMPAG